MRFFKVVRFTFRRKVLRLNFGLFSLFRQSWNYLAKCCKTQIDCLQLTHVHICLNVIKPMNLFRPS
jgi:hypothetical protein